MCYNVMRSDEGFVCRSGEIGRRPGLKIPCDESHVPVRARFPAPILLFRFAGTAKQTVFHPKKQYRGVEQLVARRAHNPEVVWFKSHPRNHNATVILIELRWHFSMPENRLIQGFSDLSAYKRTPRQAILRRGFVRFMGIAAFCSAVIVKQPSNR